MKLTFQMEGGVAHFPGVARPVTIDTDVLPSGDVGQLLELVTRAIPFLGDESQPAEAAPPADARTYRIAIDGDERRSFTVTDPLPEPVAALVRELRRHALVILRRGS